MIIKNKENLKKVILAFSVVTLAFILKVVVYNDIFECPFHSLTGLYCPGCGGIRCIGYLVNGNIYAAMKCNLLVTFSFIIFPLVLLYFAGNLKNSMSYSSLLKYKPMILLLVVILIFSVIRNIPDYPFINLRP